MEYYTVKEMSELWGVSSRMVTYHGVEKSPGFQKYVDEHANDKRMRAISADEDLFDGDVTYVTLIAE